MGIFNRPQQWLAKRIVKAQNMTLLPSWVRHHFLDVAWHWLIRSAYKNNPTVYACMRILAQNFPEPELWAFGADDSPIVNHKLRALLEKPNPDMGEAELKQFVITYAALSGNAYLWKQRNNAGEVIALWPFHDGYMSPMPGRNTEEGVVAYFVLDVGAGVTGNPWNLNRFDQMTGVAIPKTEIVHWKWAIDPENPARGIGALQAAAGDIQIGNEVKRFVYSLLKNDAKPPIVVNLAEGDEFDEETVKRLGDQWMQKYGGNNRGRPAFLEFGMNVKELGFNLEQLQIERLQNVPDAGICMGFGIHPAVVGAMVGLENATYSNFEEANKALTLQTLVPLWRSFGSEMTQSFRDEKGYEKAKIRFHLLQVRSLAEINKQERDFWLKAFEAGGISRKTFKEKIGEEAVTGDEVYKVGLAINFLPVGQSTAVAIEEPKQLGQGRKRNPFFKNLKLGNYSYYLKNINKDFSDSVMIAFFIPQEQAKEIFGLNSFSDDSAVLTPDEYHITLAYLGKVDEVDKDNLLTAVNMFLKFHMINVSGTINGYGVFSSPHLEGIKAVYLTYDSTDIARFRGLLVDSLASLGIHSQSDHGFTPHITLAYVPEDDPITIKAPIMELNFSKIVVMYGDEAIEFESLKNGRVSDKKEFSRGLTGASLEKAPKEIYNRQKTAVDALRKLRERFEPKMSGDIKNYFKSVSERGMERFESAKAGETSKETKALPFTAFQIAAFFFGQQEEIELKSLLETYYLSIVAESWSITNAILGVESQFDTNDPAVTAVLNNAGNRVKEITQTTKDALRDVLKFGNDNGWSIDDLANGRDGQGGIGAIVEMTYENRDKAIARTELGTAQQLSTVSRYENAGADGAIVFDNGFDNSHENCKILDRTIQTLAWAKENPLEHPNCVRAFGSWFDDSPEDDQ